MIRFDCFCKEIQEVKKCPLCHDKGFLDLEENELDQETKDMIKGLKEKRSQFFERFRMIDDA